MRSQIRNMNKDQQQSPLRLRRKHGDGSRSSLTAADGQRIANAQSLRAATTAGLITIIVFCVLWIMVSELFNTVFPWATVLLGFLLGFAVRRAGRGVEWYFPALAAALTIAGSVVANVVLAASVRAEQDGVSTLQIMQSFSSYTLPDFFSVVWNIGDTFFAVLAAGVAAFYSQRRLSRDEYYALRLWREEQDSG